MQYQNGSMVSHNNGMYTASIDRVDGTSSTRGNTHYNAIEIHGTDREALYAEREIIRSALNKANRENV